MRFTFLSKFPFSFKLGLILSVCFFAVFLNLYLFVQYAPNANTGSYNITTTSKANFIKLKEEGRRISFQLINKGKKKNRKSVDNERHMVFLFHGLPGSRHFRHTEELAILKEYFNNTQILRYDRPGIGFTSPSNEPRIETVVKDGLKMVKSMKLKKDRIGVIGFGLGTPYAIAFAQQVGCPLSLISPIGKIMKYPTQKSRKSPELIDDASTVFRWYESLKGSRFNSYLPLMSFQSFWIRLWSQLGYVCEAEYWYKNLSDRLKVISRKELETLFFVPDYVEFSDSKESTTSEKEESCEEEEELEIDEDWGNMMNDTLVEMFRQGVLGVIEEIEVLFGEKWNKMNLVGRTKKKSGLGKVKIFRGLDDELTSKKSVDSMIEEFRNDEKLEVVVNEMDGESHFSSFKMAFKDAVEFLVGENL